MSLKKIRPVRLASTGRHLFDAEVGLGTDVRLDDIIPTHAYRV